MPIFEIPDNKTSTVNKKSDLKWSTSLFNAMRTDLEVKPSNGF